MNDDRPEPEFNGYQIVVPRRLLDELARDDTDSPVVPVTAAEARERRIINRRFEL